MAQKPILGGIIPHLRMSIGGRIYKHWSTVKRSAIELQAPWVGWFYHKLRWLSSNFMIPDVVTCITIVFLESHSLGHYLCILLSCLIMMTSNQVIRFHDCRHTAATLMLSHGIPPVIVAGMLGHSISILLTTYAHFIPTMQDQAAQLMDDILTPIPIDLK